VYFYIIQQQYYCVIDPHANNLPQIRPQMNTDYADFADKVKVSFLIFSALIREVVSYCNFDRRLS